MAAGYTAGTGLELLRAALSSSPNTFVGTRVHVNYQGAWYAGTVKDTPENDKDGKGRWTVQCDADEEGTLTYSKKIVAFAEQSQCRFASGNFKLAWDWFTVEEAKQMVVESPEALGFHMQISVGSRVEAFYQGSWYPGAVTKLPEDDPESKDRYSVQCDADNEGILTYTKSIRADPADTSKRNVVIVKRGATRISGPKEGIWTALIPKLLLPPSGSPELFQDGWSASDDACAPGKEWKRPGRGDGFEDGQISLFQGISPQDMRQGALGDCWFISACAAMAEYPAALMDLFDKRELCPEGRYKVKLFSIASGVWKEYELDDQLPVNGATAAYVHTTADGEIWPCLLEKAMAMHMGGYKAMDGGWSIFAFGTLTGCSVLTTSKLQDDGSWRVVTNTWADDAGNGAQDTNPAICSAAEFLELLGNSSDANFLMCAASHAGKDTDISEEGIVQGHAFSLLQVRRNVAGSGIDLLQLRNPWGHTEWTGDWSDGSPLWQENPEVAQECGHEEVNDGTFWMTWEDFCNSYYKVYIACKQMSTSNRKKMGKGS